MKKGVLILSVGPNVSFGLYGKDLLHSVPLNVILKTILSAMFCLS